VRRDIFGLGPKECRPVAVKPGSVIYTKSGGIHGIENPNAQPLRFVAFLYHST
jgi:oxalate decarboxylase/phosphoglucose isomerase-like protein (cupin superfamily)